MSFLAPFEIIAMNKGIEEGKEEGSIDEARYALLEILEILHGETPLPLKTAVNGIQNLAVIRDLRRQTLLGNSLEDMKRLIFEQAHCKE